MRSDPPSFPPTPPTDPLDEQLRAVGGQLDRAAPPVAPAELGNATPATEVAHLRPVPAADDATGVLPLVPLAALPGEPGGPRRRPRWLLGAAAAAIVAVGVGATTLAGGDDDVRTSPVELQPASEGDGAASAPLPDDLPPVFGELEAIGERFAACMDEAGFPVDPEASGVDGFEDLAEVVADPALPDAVGACLAASGLDEVELGDVLAGLGDLPALDDLEGFEDFEDFEGFDGFEGFGDLEQVFGELLEGIDMSEVVDQLDAFLEEVEVDDELGDRLAEEGARADRVVACLAERGWSADQLPQLDDLVSDPAARQRFHDDLQACTTEG